jgi:hypothetical protein
MDRGRERFSCILDAAVSLSFARKEKKEKKKAGNLSLFFLNVAASVSAFSYLQ